MLMGTRIAPSMTGYLHLGHLYHLIWVYAYADKLNLPIYLRIEDHDIARSRFAYEKALLKDLKAFGFEWSGNLLRQSDHQYFYEKQLKTLNKAGLVYGCNCSRREILELQEKNSNELLYCGTCSRKKLPLDGNTVRFRVTSDEIIFKDGYFGRQKQKPSKQCGDFPIRDRSGQYTYQFCCVCDDIRQGVSHVIRGEDLLESTARQILLFKAFHVPAPSYFHHPLLYDENGKKLSKRNQSMSLRAQLDNKVSSEILLGKALSKNQAITLSAAIRFISGQINLFA